MTMCSSNWLYQTSYDSAMDLSGDELTTQDEFISIEVRNPRTHLNKTKALYTDYEIYVQTNSIAFSKSSSSVRRRYSDFQWLHNRLSTQFFLERRLPELPPKRLLGRFKRQFLKYRKRGLQRFLENIAKESIYLSDVSVHLFLQTDLTINEIERRLGGTESCEELVDVLQDDRRNIKNVKLACDKHDDDCECGVHFDFDSGFSYSTTGSINDITQPSHESCQFFNSKKFNENYVHSCLKADMSYEVLQKKKLGQTACESSLFAEDEGSIDYDADNEVDETLDLETSPFLEIDDDLLFIFEKNIGQEYSLDRAVELIQKRTKPSERFFAPDLDSDECFDISEYDIIETDSESKFLNNLIERISQPYTKSKVSTNSSVRSSISEKEGSQLKKNKFIIAKVRSLPKLRFPMKHGEKNKLVSRKLTPDFSKVNKLKQDSKNFDKSLFKQFYDDSSIPKTEQTQLNIGPHSSDDYLTTIHTVASKDSHLDTQSGDAPPLQFYSCTRRRTKRGSTSNSLKHRGKQFGRFSVSAVKPYLSSLFESSLQTRCKYENKLKKENQIISTDVFKCTLIPKNSNDLQLLQTYEIL